MPTAKVTIETLRDVNYGPTERLIMGVLIGSYPRPRTTESIAFEAWDEHPADEPKGAAGVIRVLVLKLRKKLKPFGWTIASGGTGRAAPGYVLQPIKK